MQSESQVFLNFLKFNSRVLIFQDSGVKILESSESSNYKQNLAVKLTLTTLKCTVAYQKYYHLILLNSVSSIKSTSDPGSWSPIVSLPNNPQLTPPLGPLYVVSLPSSPRVTPAVGPL